jgi:PAS domain S-box-containing protein
MPQSPDGIWIIDAKALTLYASQRMSEILGVSRNTMLGQPSFNYVFPEDFDSGNWFFNGGYQGNVHLFRIRLRRADGSTIWVDAKVTPMRDLLGAVTGAIGTFKVVESAKSRGEPRWNA